MKYLASIFAAAILFACGTTPEPAQPEAAPAPVQNAPAHAPEVIDTGDSTTVRGNSIVFFHPSKGELTGNLDEFDALFMKAAGAISAAPGVEGVTVHISSDAVIDLDVSDDRSYLLRRSDRTESFGMVLYKFDKGPYFVDGMRSEEDYRGFIARYFSE